MYLGAIVKNSGLILLILLPKQSLKKKVLKGSKIVKNFYTLNASGIVEITVPQSESKFPESKDYLLLIILYYF